MSNAISLSQKQKTQTSLHSIRVAPENWMDKDRFDELLQMLQEYPCGITEVALFTSSIHTPLRLEELQQRIAVIETRMVKLRSAGFTAGINHLTTIGHHCEDLDAGPGNRYTYMTNIHGQVCKGSYCMRNPELIREYVIPCYTVMAKAGPDFIWIDDDVRLGHLPIGYGCFCDHCIQMFNEKHGYTHTRQSLREALNENNPVLRMQWLDHNSDAICRLFSSIAEVVYGIDPDIRLGFMTGERYFEGYQFARYADALSDGGRHQIMWRPGGGAYDDFCFDHILAKQDEIGRQNAYLPPYVTMIQSEIENFPYQMMKKTPCSTAVEAAMGMTVGCTGAAFNILPSETLEPIRNAVPHLQAINRLTGFYKTQQQLFAQLVPHGIHTGWTPSSQAACPAGEFVNMYGGMYASYAREMFLFGLPQAFHPDFASVTMLTGQSAAVMEDDEIRRLLTGGVYLDVSALEYLNQRGFGHLTGFTAGENFPVDAREQYLEHALHTGIAGCIRNCRQAFHAGDSYAILPQSDRCEILSRLIDYHDRVKCGCACGIFENELGGRICAAGYYPFDWVSDWPKTIQMKRLFVWLSGGTIPSFIDSYHRIRNMTLVGENRVCVSLFNTTNDDLTDVHVAVCGETDRAVLYAMYEGEGELRAEHTIVLSGSCYNIFSIDRIKAYEGMILAI